MNKQAIEALKELYEFAKHKLDDPSRAEDSKIFRDALAAIDQLEREDFEQMRKDAERYRELMESMAIDDANYPIQFNTQPAGYNGGKFMWVEFGVLAPEWEKPSPELFTAAIDAAMEEQKNG